MSGPALGGPAVESYLAEVSARLPGPVRTHAGIVAELRSGLLDATDAHRSAGLPATQAARAAITEFGDPGQVANGFRAEIAARQARRVSISLLATGPLVGTVWITAALASHLAEPARWVDASPGLRAGLGLVAVAIAAEVWAVLLGVAVTGRLTRWLPARPRLGPTAAVIAGAGAACADLVMLALLTSQLATMPGQLAPLPIAFAAAASLTRLTLAARAAHRCLATRTAL